MRHRLACIQAEIQTHLSHLIMIEGRGDGIRSEGGLVALFLEADLQQFP